MSIRPGQYDIIIRRGSTFSYSLTIEIASSPIDLTGFTAKFQVKTNKALDDTAVLSLDEMSGITLGGAAGTVAVVATDEETAVISAGIAYYDLVLIDGSGAANAYIEGRVTIEEGVSA